MAYHILFSFYLYQFVKSFYNAHRETALPGYPRQAKKSQEVYLTPYGLQREMILMSNRCATLHFLQITRAAYCVLQYTTLHSESGGKKRHLQTALVMMIQLHGGSKSGVLGCRHHQTMCLDRHLVSELPAYGCANRTTYLMGFAAQASLPESSYSPPRKRVILSICGQMSK